MNKNTFGTVRFDPKQRARFRDGTLVKEWARQYPSIFDDDDVRITQKQPSYHFFEWLAAITVFTATGYLSLVEKYRSRSHPRKRRILQRLFDKKALQCIMTRGTQCPDLLCYTPDFKSCFFCEVKGLTDKLRDVQKIRFDELQQITGRDVYILEFKKL